MGRQSRAVLLVMFAAACGGGGGNPVTPSSPGPSVGPAGGTVTSADGLATLVVPAGALTAAQPIAIRPAGAVPLDPMAIPGSAYQITPFVPFAINAVLTIRYDPARLPSGVEEQEMRLFGVNGEVWNGVGDSTNDGTSHEAVGPIRQTATFGVRWAGRPCVHPQDDQFDFLLGQWTTNGSALPNGTSDVVRDLGDACAVDETLAQGAERIRAIKVFSARDGRWHENWVDTNGRRGVKLGGLERRRMVLYENADSRQAWEPLADGRIRFTSERAAGSTWTLVGEGLYTPR